MIPSLVFARQDARVFDEICGWLKVNRRHVSAQRLENLLGQFPEEARRLVSAVMAFANPKKPSASPLGGGRLEPLFPGGPVAALDGSVEPAFAAKGFSRPPLPGAFRVHVPDLGRPVCLALRLRAVFGSGSRAEIATYLCLMRGSWEVTAEVSRFAAYDRRNVLEALNRLVEGGVVERRRGRGEWEWRIDQERWRVWLDLPPGGPVYFDWQAALRGLLELWSYFRAEEVSDWSDYIRASRAREAMDRAAPLLSAFQGWARIDPSRYHGAEYAKAFEVDIEALITRHLEAR